MRNNLKGHVLALSKNVDRPTKGSNLSIEGIKIIQLVSILKIDIRYQWQYIDKVARYRNKESQILPNTVYSRSRGKSTLIK